MLTISEVWDYCCEGCGETEVVQHKYTPDALRVITALPEGWLTVKQGRGQSHFCCVECLREYLNQGPKQLLLFPG